LISEGPHLKGSPRV